MAQLRRERLKKLERLRARGVDPYPTRTHCSHTTAEALAILKHYREEEPEGEGPPDIVALCGRIVGMRVMGKASFAHIQDGSGAMQIHLTHDGLGAQAYDQWRRDLDTGDVISAEGSLFFTKTGEPTLRAGSLSLLAKSLRPLPEKWHGLKDREARYRQRYLDLLSNPESRRILETRSRIVGAIRRFLDARGYLEVETPVLQPLYGGAAARPFTTQYQALDQTMYLRISDELYLKRLIIGGLDRVYEIGKDFRNEGLSRTNSPEFTQIEIYEAYGDYETMMELTEACFAAVAEEVLGSPRLTYQGTEIDLAPPWRRVSLQEAIEETTGIDILAAPDLESLAGAVEERGLKVDAKPTWGGLVDEILKEHTEPTLIQPTFVKDYPKEISPLAKAKPGEPHLAERFEFFIGGLEMGNAFTELNDPLEQRARFEAQRQALEAGDADAHPIDEDFLTALEHGMPPTGGIGWGIDRMAMLFADQASIREVIPFPTLRQKPS
ncbi:MAG: lysine--tRNA ligase [Anaerolineae bacterium]